jgi:TonB-linked SusC/RagA family outer membrane protein
VRARLRQIRAVAGLVAFLPAFVSAQQQTSGTITGKVTDKSSQQPVADAQILIIGTQRGTRSDETGAYRIGSVPPGPVRLRVLRLGYTAQAETVTVAAGQTATANFALEATATTLDQVVINATGESERKRETGNAVASIRADSIPKTVVNDVSDLLSSRAAGVVVTQTSGTTGGGSRIRIRGSNSVSLSNEPLIIIDGIRTNTDAGGSSISVGGQNPTRLDDLNPEDIESLEIIKGPAAAALYGTAAANGVIQITTKRGRAGKTTWNGYADGGGLREITDFPANYRQVGTRPSGSRTGNCYLILQSQGGCTPKSDSLLAFNPLEDNSPFVNGWRQQFGVNASGGNELAQYFVAGDYDREHGVYTNNLTKRTNFRANINSALNPKFDVAVRTGYNQVRTQFPQNDNNDQGPLGNGLLGTQPLTSANGGYLFFSPDVFNNILTTQSVDRLTGAADARYRPTSWLNVTGIAGVDYAGRDDKQLTPPNLVLGDRRELGNANSNPYSLWTYTANLTGTATYHPKPSIEATTAIGTQYTKELVKGTQGFGEGLAAGSGSLAGATTSFAVTEQNSDIVTVGGYAQQRFAWRDRVFLTGAVRGDDNSAFGQDFKLIYYPSVSLSWVIGEEGFFPKNDLLSSLRLRSAYGQSGQRPGFRNAITYYTAVSYKRNGQDVGGVQLGTPIGNVQLKPERSSEYELGFDAGFLKDRLNLEATYYNKDTRDALVQRVLPPSSGAASRFENLGEVTNKGFEGTLNAQLLNGTNFKWDVTLNGSTTKNKLVEIGQGIDTIFFGLGSNNGDPIQRHAEGLPLGGYWQKPIKSYSDKNGDGIIGLDEVELDDNARYLGQPLPTREMTINSGVTLLKYFRVTGLLDYRGGFKVYNATEQFRCVVFVNCRTAQDKSAPLAEQARAAASWNGSDAGYVEDGTFWKLREVAVTLTAPKSWVGKGRFSTASLTIAGRNLGTWTDYTGFDPEINFNGTSNFSTAEFLTQPNVRYFTARVSLGW